MWLEEKQALQEETKEHIWRRIKKEAQKQVKGRSEGENKKDIAGGIRYNGTDYVHWDDDERRGSTTPTRNVLADLLFQHKKIYIYIHCDYIMMSSERKFLLS